MSEVDKTQANTAERDDLGMEGGSDGLGSDPGESDMDSIHSEVATYDY
jgi:hypothetical protein